MSARGHPRGRQGGLTLVEVMVALVLGLVLVLGVLGTYLGQRQALRLHENLARLQENGRFAFELLAREARGAGYGHCGTRLTANTLRKPPPAPPDWWADTDAGPVRAYGPQDASPGIAGWGTAPGDRAPGTGAVLLLRASDDPALAQPVLQHDLSRHRFTLASLGPLAAGDILVACDGRRSALFEASAIDAAQRTVSHDATGRNCTDALGGVGPGCASRYEARYEPRHGASLSRWDPAFWYIGANSLGTRSLYRAGLGQGGAGSGQVGRQEMVRGIHDLQVEVLTRDDTQGGQLAAHWLPPAALGPGGWNQPDRAVVALRWTLLLRSDEPVGSDGLPLTRQVVTVTALRNRG